MMQDYFSNSINEIKCDIQELENSLIVCCKEKNNSLRIKNYYG